MLGFDRGKRRDFLGCRGNANTIIEARTTVVGKRVAGGGSGGIGEL